jgi:hypothetical protein
LEYDAESNGGVVDKLSRTRCYAAMRTLHTYGLAATTLVLFCLSSSACQKDEPATTTKSAASTPKQAAANVDPKNPCTIPSASPEHVAQALGTGKLSGPTLIDTSITKKCQFHGADRNIGDAVAIELDLNATGATFDSARRMIEQYLKGPTTDVPGFGDKAFSHTKSTDIGTTKLVTNTLCVLKGKTMVIISSPAPFEKIRALETDVLRDLGA